MERRRIKYYGPNDMGSGWSLREAETFLLNWDERVRDVKINDVLELHNIKLYFDAGMRLENWTEDQYCEFCEKCKLIPGIMGKYCSAISDTTITVLCKDVTWKYADDFWDVLCIYKVYNRISPDTMKALLDADDRIVWHLLKQKMFSAHFGEVIADHLVHNQYTAERLVSHFLEAHGDTYGQMYFPIEFTQDMRDKALLDYVEREDGNPNYLRLLERSQSTKEFPVSDRLRLKARRKSDLLQERIFADSMGMRYGAQVSFKSIPDGSIEESFENNMICTAYSHEWVKENLDYPTLLNNFIYLFGYVDQEYRCCFPSKKSDLGVFERHLGVKGKKDYQVGIAFDVTRIHSTLQMFAYQEELHQHDIRLENIFQWFFEVYLQEEFNAVGFSYCPPSEGTTYAEKCKLLASAIDGVLKQYRLFCEDGYVDRELLEISSGHVVFGDLVSMREKKYAYSNSSELQTEQYALYSDQSMMNYTERTGSKYQTLPQLLILEKITKKDFAEFQLRDLKWLISRGVVCADTDGYLQINKVRAYVLKDLFHNEVICPAYCAPVVEKQIEEMATVGDIRFENTLFSKPEQDYLNYVLNKSEFSNGLDLRNRYSHDTNSLDEKTQSQDYFELLKIMVLIIIKINEEFCMKQ